jgi:tetratricopeptide (TPR) repeat protein
MQKWVFVVAFFLFLFMGVPGNQGQDILSDSAKLYDVAMEFYYQGRYTESIEAFSKLINTFPTSRSVSYAVYMIGQAYLWMEKPDEAIRQFNLYLRQYPDGDRVSEGRRASRWQERRGSKEVPAHPSPAGSFSGIFPRWPKTKRRICAQIFCLILKP